MKALDKIKSWFKRGGAAIGMTKILQKVTDHPKINVDESEYRRINEALMHYRGTFPDEQYKNYKGDLKKRKFYDLGMPEVVSSYIAGLVFNESCEITVSTVSTDENNEKIAEDAADVFVQSVLASNQFKKNLSRYLAPMYALGGLAARPYVDSETKQLKFNWALANTFYPLKSNTNNISECAIVTTSTRADGKDRYYYTLFEFHEWGENGDYLITNELYETKEKDEVGYMVPLSTLYDGLRKTSIMENLSRPMFSYVKPNGFNNINPSSPLGLGIVDNAKKVLDQINRTNNQMEWDMYKAKPRIAASQHFGKSVPSENKIGYDLVVDDDSEEFLFSEQDSNEAFIKDLSLKFDPKPYVDKINFHFKMMEKKLQLSLGTFSYDGGEGIKTATEVVSEDSETFRNRNSQITEVEQFIKELVITICELGLWAGIYSGPVPTHDQIGVDFDDGIFTDKNAQLEYYSKAKLNGLIPDVEAIMRVFGIPKVEAETWVEMIKQQRLSANPAHQEVMNEVSLFGKRE